MENNSYLLSYHPEHIEGAELKKTANKLLLEHSAPLSTTFQAIPSASASSFLANEDLSAENFSAFLEQHEWKQRPISILLRTEDVAFRTLNFPFQDPKKIRQILPFEIENELLEDVSEMHYCSSVQPTESGQSQVLVLLMKRQLLESLKQHCSKQELIIRNIDCSALALFRATHAFAGSDGLQVYIGADEAFVSTIIEGVFRTAKIFPNRIASLIRSISDDPSIDPQTLFKIVLQGPSASHKKLSPQEQKWVQEIQEELRELCTQFTLYWRTHAGGSQFKIAFYGLFAPLFEWDQVVFRLYLQDTSSLSEKETPSQEEVTKDSSSSAKESSLRESTDSEFSLPATRSETNLVTADSFIPPEQRSYWGILGDLSHPVPNAEGSGEVGLYYPESFEKHGLSFYAEGTTWRRILKKHPFAILCSFVLIFSLLTGSFVSYRLKHSVLQQEVQILSKDIQNKLRHLLPESKEKKIQPKVALLQNQIQQRKTYLAMSQQFESRNYKNLNLMQNLSQFFTEGIPLQLDRIEYGKERFSISGTIDSYDSLQLLKAKLSAMEAFREKRIVGNNRKSSEGIIFRISIE